MTYYTTSLVSIVLVTVECRVSATCRCSMVSGGDRRSQCRPPHNFCVSWEFGKVGWTAENVKVRSPASILRRLDETNSGWRAVEASTRHRDCHVCRSGLHRSRRFNLSFSIQHTYIYNPCRRRWLMALSTLSHIPNRRANQSHCSTFLRTQYFISSRMCILEIIWSYFCRHKKYVRLLCAKMVAHNAWLCPSWIGH